MNSIPKRLPKDIDNPLILNEAGWTWLVILSSWIAVAVYFFW